MLPAGNFTASQIRNDLLTWTVHLPLVLHVWALFHHNPTDSATVIDQVGWYADPTASCGRLTLLIAVSSLIYLVIASSLPIPLNTDRSCRCIEHKVAAQALARVDSAAYLLDS